MEYWLDLAQGPLFRLCFLIMVLGLIRNLGIALVGMARAYMLAGDRDISWLKVARKTASWLVPFSHLNTNNRLAYTVTSFVFHIGVIFVPVFLFAHMRLWEQGTGIRWPALPTWWADQLTLIVIITGTGLVMGRVAYAQSRSISRFQDLILPTLIVFTFLTGYVAAHPPWNPFSYRGMLVVHVLSGNLLLLLIPFSKLTHVVLWPFTQFATELGWRFPPGAGAKIVATLGKEDRV